MTTEVSAHLDHRPPEVVPTISREWSLPLLLRQSIPGLMLLGIGSFAISPISDPDAFWHIRAGQELPSNWQFAGDDPWNTFATEPWVLHEWLPQLLIGAVTEFAGLPGLAVLMAAVVVSLTYLLYRLARMHTSILVSALLSAISVIGMSMSLSPRPHVVTFGFAALVTSAWLRTATDGRPRWWLIPLTWVWACSHGMWFIGVVIGVGAVIPMMVNCPSRRFARRVASIPILSLAAATLTPAGPELLLAPLTVGGYTEFVSEWAPPSIFAFPVICALSLLAVPVLNWSNSERKAHLVEVVLVVIAVGLILAYSRTVAVGAAMAVPLAARAIGDRPFTRERRATRESLLTGVLAGAGIVVATALGPTQAAEAGRVPTEFSGYLNALPENSVVCNDYVLGGWLLWAHPQIRPVVDGRTEIYSVNYMRDVVNWQRAGPDWQDFMAKAECRVAIVPSNGATAAAIIDSLGWTEVASHREFSLLVAPALQQDQD